MFLIEGTHHVIHVEENEDGGVHFKLFEGTLRDGGGRASLSNIGDQIDSFVSETDMVTLAKTLRLEYPNA